MRHNIPEKVDFDVESCILSASTAKERDIFGRVVSKASAIAAATSRMTSSQRRRSGNTVVDDPVQTGDDDADTVSTEVSSIYVCSVETAAAPGKFQQVAAVTDGVSIVFVCARASYYLKFVELGVQY